LEAKIAQLGVGHLFKIFEREIKAPGDGIIIFQGMQDPKMFADYGRENDVPVIRVSEAKNGHTETLLATLSHEMLHLRLDLIGDRSNHGVRFRRMAAQVCRAHGFDLKAF
jgi:SprT-like family